MKHTHAIACYVASIIAIIFFAIVLNSCSQLRHYKKVAKDAYPRSEAKRKILAPVLAAEFPVKETTKEDSNKNVVYKPVFDSVRENNYKKFIRELQKRCAERREIDVDSLIEEMKASIPPDTVEVTKNYYKTTTVRDSAAMRTQQIYYEDLLKVAQKKYDVLLSTDDKRKDSLYKVTTAYNTIKAGTKSNVQLGKWFLKNNWWWMLIVVGLLVGFQLLKSKFTLPFKL